MTMRRLGLVALISFTLLFAGCASSPTITFRTITYFPDESIEDSLVDLSIGETRKVVLASKELASSDESVILDIKVLESVSTGTLKLKKITYESRAEHHREKSGDVDTTRFYVWENILYTLPSVKLESIINIRSQTSFTKRRSRILQETLVYKDGRDVDASKAAGNAFHCTRRCDASKNCGGVTTHSYVDGEEVKYGWRGFQGTSVSENESRLEKHCEARLKALVDNTSFLQAPRTEDKVYPADDQNIEILSSPSWINPKVNTTKNGSTIVVHPKSSITKYSFEDDPNPLGLPKKYLHLTELREPMTFALVLGHSSGVKANVSIRYYDWTPVLAEIARIESLGYGYVRLSSNEKNVEILVNGKVLGKIDDVNRPLVAKLSEGQHVIRAQKEYFGSKTIEVSMDRDDAFAYHFELRPAGNLSEELGTGKIIQLTGQLNVLTSRNDLKVSIEGAERIPPFRLPNIASGEHLIVVKTPEGEFRTRIVVEPNKRNVLNLDNLIPN